MPRVLATDEARDAIQTMQRIITGNLSAEIGNLDRQGQRLSDSNVWDGPLAQQFRDQHWPDTKRALDRCLSELDELRGRLGQINQDIINAGGGQR